MGLIIEAIRNGDHHINWWAFIVGWIIAWPVAAIVLLASCGLVLSEAAEDLEEALAPTPGPTIVSRVLPTHTPRATAIPSRDLATQESPTGRALPTYTPRPMGTPDPIVAVTPTATTLPSVTPATSAPATPEPSPTTSPTPTLTVASTATPVRAATPIPTPIPTAAPTPTPTPPVSLYGEGTDVRRIVLSEGLWIVEIVVQDNEDCSVGVCIPSLFAVWIESSEGGGRELLANEIGNAWRGRSTLRVGGGLFSSIEPGKQLVSVEGSGTWEIHLTRE